MRRRPRPAFTLIETIASIVIIAVAVPPMLWAIREAHLKRANPVLTSRARWVATERMEEIIADRHSTTRGYAYLIPGNYAAQPVIVGYPGFSRTVTLTETAADLVSAGTGYMNVDVAVSWTDGAGTARTLTVSSVVTEYTP